MVAFPLAHMRLVPPVGAALAGAGVAATFALLPPATLAVVTWGSGIAALVPAAAPPLGVTARLVLAMGGGAVAAAIVWSALYLLFGQGGVLAGGEGKPAVRRADAHPDAPPRWPMSAADLGTPLMEVERPIPVDLEQPLAAFDPGSILAAPMEPVRPVAPLAPPPPPPTPLSPSPSPLPPPLPLARGERIETFELTPMVRGEPPRPVPTAPPTIEMLLRRLEEGAKRRTAQAG